MTIQDKKNDFLNLVEHAKNDIQSVRTNRATPAMLENIRVDTYGAKMPLNQIGSISSPEPTQLLVETWDKNLLKNVEQAIETASLGFGIKNEGTYLRLTMSPMTEETRKKIIKSLHEKIETARITLRNLRDKIKEEIITAEKNKEISEDEKYKLIDDLDEMTREHTEIINTLGKKKEEEIKL